jgi:hypothetical protein
MTKQDTEQSSESRPAAATPKAAESAAAPKKRPLAGFVIAAGSLALLFGIAALKGRVRDDAETQ